MSVNEKNILDVIQDILEKHEDSITVRKLAQELPRKTREQLGIKSNASEKVIIKKLGAGLEERFVLRKKGRAQHISIPCENVNVLDVIQDILEKHKGFIKASQLAPELPSNAREQLGIKSNASGQAIMKKLGAELEERFVLRKKGKDQYILIPCEPEDLLMSFLDDTKAITQKELSKVLSVLYAEDVATILTELVNSGRVRIVFDAILPAKLFLVKEGIVQKERKSETQTVKSEECTQGAFRAAYDELHKFREFVRICDLRRELNWSREVFDEMMRKLRDNRTIQLFRADESMLTEDEIQDCFIDDRNFIMGIMTWNGR